MTLSHKEWVDNEYQQWVKALQESTVDNFGSHPMVRRMLGDVDRRDFNLPITLKLGSAFQLLLIGHIGGDFINNIYRMAYYSDKVLKQRPKFIVEIGGGVGQFYAVLRALGYQGKYYIYDLKEVREFQRKYLDRVTELTGLNTEIDYLSEFDFCVSFYAIGEMDDKTKNWYIQNVVKQTPHGLIIWNPHSGASDEIGFDCKIEDEYPLTHPNNKMLTW